MASYRYLVIPIRQSDGGFGEYDAVSMEATKARSVKEAVKIMSEGIETTAVELPNEDLAFNGDDITGLIHNEPSRVYAYRDAYGYWAYFGLEKRW